MPIPAHSPARTASRLRHRVAAAAAALRRVLGVPDYERYLAHMRRHHPAEPLLSADEFARDFLERRYNRPGSRCC